MARKFVADRSAQVAIRTIFDSAKYRAKNGSHYNSSGELSGRRKAFKITKEYLLSILQKQNGQCALTGVPLTFVTARTIKEANVVGDPKDYTATNVSLDRIDPRYGYIYGNVQLVTYFANKAKGEMTTKQFLTMCKNVVKKFG